MTAQYALSECKDTKNKQTKQNTSLSKLEISPPQKS